MNFQPPIPWNNLPPLPEPSQLESVTILKSLIPARAALAELKGASLRLPDPALLLNSVILQESRESSAIENIVTTQDALYQAALFPFEISSVVKEVIHYREAMYGGWDLLKNSGLITGNTAVLVMQILRGIDDNIRKTPGTRIIDTRTNEILYSPPDTLSLPGHIADWEQFVNAETGNTDPLIRMAMMHYQFEAIHPFTDGNGRTGRILNILYLIKEKVLDMPVLYHSGYINRNRSMYYKLLHDVTVKQQWEPWILFMIDCITNTAIQTLRLLEEIMLLRDQFLASLKGISNKLPVTELTDSLFRSPYTKINMLVNAGLGSRPTIKNYLSQMTERDLLKKYRKGNEYYYVNHRLMDLLSRAESYSL